MATDFELMLLSTNVYNNLSTKDGENTVKINGQNHQTQTFGNTSFVENNGVLELEGWNVIQVIIPQDLSGRPVTDGNTDFYAAVYYKESSNEFVIAFRGTDSWNPFGGDLSENSTLSWDSEQVVSLKNFMKRLSNNEVFKNVTQNSSDYTINFTGHSLGGKLAQVAYWESYNKTFPGIQLNGNTRTVTFNSAPVWLNWQTPKWFCHDTHPVLQFIEVNININDKTSFLPHQHHTCILNCLKI